ncbi:MAG: hypothetical protein QM790_20795 [Nibricoccus sp.]
MIFRFPAHRFFWVRLAFLGAITLLAADQPYAAPPAQTTPQAGQTPPPENNEPSTSSDKPLLSELRTRMMEDMLRMREFFDTTIPGTLKKYNLVFGFSPRASDLRRGEYMRLPATLRYGLGDRWELQGGITPFCPNPFNNGNEHRWGPGLISLGVRYNWGHWGKVFDSVTLGLDGRTPLGQPPANLIDSFAHLVPLITFSRPLPFKYTNFYLNLVYDRAFDAPFRDSPPPPPAIIRRHVFFVAPSVLYKPGEFGGFVSYSWRHFFDETIGVHLGHEIKAGPIWDVPLRRTQSWGLPGKWQVELAGRVTFEEGMKTDKGISVRVRWRTSLREVFSKKSYQRKPIK